MTILGFSCTVLITWEGTMRWVYPPGRKKFEMTDWTSCSTFLQGLQKYIPKPVQVL